MGKTTGKYAFAVLGSFFLGVAAQRITEAPGVNFLVTMGILLALMSLDEMLRQHRGGSS